MKIDAIISQLEEIACEFYSIARFSESDDNLPKAVENYNKGRGVDVAVSVLRHAAALEELKIVPIDTIIAREPNYSKEVPIG